jgi:hypothetical protein
MPRPGSLSFDAGAGRGDALLGGVTGRSDCGIALGGPLLEAQLTAVENFRAGGAEFRLIFLALGVGCGDSSFGLLNCAQSALAALGQSAHKRAVKQETVGDQKKDKDDYGRYGAEHKIAELTQKFIYHD